MAQTTLDVTTLLSQHHPIIRYTKGGNKNDQSTAHTGDITTVRGSGQARLKDFTTDLRDYIKAND